MILALICAILAGVAYAIEELHDHGKLKWMKEASTSFWGDLSWKRKYKNGLPKNGPKFWGSTTFLVALTDGPHLMQFVYFTLGPLSVGFLMGNHYYSLGAWLLIHLVHFITYKLASK